jgi:hypothetical protein
MTVDKRRRGSAILRNILLMCSAFMIASGACISIGDRLGLWAPISAHTAVVLAAGLAALTALTFLPVGRLSRGLAHSSQQSRGEVVVYLVAVGIAFVVAFLIVTPH